MAKTTHVYIGVKDGEIRAFCFDDPGCEKGTEAITSRWPSMGRVTSRIPIEEFNRRMADQVPNQC